MKKIILLMALFFIIGCFNNANLILPGKQAGNYIIEKSTLKEILGEDTKKNRNEFAHKGLYFQFEQGDKLTGITITSSKYITDKGIRIGSTIQEVVKAYGEPRQTRIKNEKIAIDVLVYEGIAFSHNSKEITAIQVIKNSR